jgi:hypothetical protein
MVPDESRPLRYSPQLPVKLKAVDRLLLRMSTGWLGSKAPVRSAAGNGCNPEAVSQWAGEANLI